VPVTRRFPAETCSSGIPNLSPDLLSNGRTNLNGWTGSVEGKVLPFIGLVADFSGLYGSAAVAPNPACTGIVGGLCSGLSASTHIQSFLFGPRVSVSVGKVRPFANALIGAGHISESASGFSESNTSFAHALGGGIDYHFDSPHQLAPAGRLAANAFLQHHAEQCPYFDRDRGSLLVRDGSAPANSSLGAPRIKRRFQFELEQLRRWRIVPKSRVLRTGLYSNMYGH